MKTFLTAFALCLAVLFGFAFIVSSVTHALHAAPFRMVAGLTLAASACFLIALGLGLSATDEANLSIQATRDHYKRGFSLRAPHGKPMTWVYVGKYLTLNRGYLFNV